MESKRLQLKKASILFQNSIIMFSKKSSVIKYTGKEMNYAIFREGGTQ